MPEKLKKQIKDNHGNLKTVVYDVPVFLEYQIPNGNLPPETEAHALFYYYLLARKNYEEQSDPIILEGEIDPTYDYRQLFRSIANIYGVRPENMVHYWPHVDMQCLMLRLPKLPDEERYRFNRPVEIETN